MALLLEAGFDVNIVERVEMEKTMRKIVLALLGAALMAGSATQVAYAKSHHHVVRHERHYTSERFLNSNAAVIPAPQAGNDGGMGGWASMTGFN
jgi:hypothetical protein